MAVPRDCARMSFIRELTAQERECAPITIDVIVEGQPLVLLDVTIGENAHSNVSADSPLGNVAVWITAVVRKSTNAAALRRIDELSRVD